MADQKKGNFRMYLMGIVHLVCCGLLLAFVLGGISIGMVTSYLQDSLVPLGVGLTVIGIFWVEYRLWRGSGLHRN